MFPVLEKVVYRAYGKLRMSTTPGSSLPLVDGTSFGFALRYGDNTLYNQVNGTLMNMREDGRPMFLLHS